MHHAGAPTMSGPPLCSMHDRVSRLRLLIQTTALCYAKHRRPSLSTLHHGTKCRLRLASRMALQPSSTSPHPSSCSLLGSGYLKSAFSSRNSIHPFKKFEPLQFTEASATVAHFISGTCICGTTKATLVVTPSSMLGNMFVCVQPTTARARH